MSVCSRRSAFQRQLDDRFAAFFSDIKWNFTNFLADRKGNVVQRFEPAVTPDSAEVSSAIEKLLKQ